MARKGIIPAGGSGKSAADLVTHVKGRAGSYKQWLRPNCKV
ncbi:MAG: hypothetical protein R6V41_07105 [Desulfobacteraceae bacterium]